MKLKSILSNTLMTLILFVSIALPFSLLSSHAVVAAEPPKPVILITGANRGIGLALAEKFHSQGYKVIATARKPEQAVELKKLGVQVEKLDITSAESVSQLSKKLSHQPIDILLNNAGIGGHSTQNFESLDIDKLAKVLDVNSLGALRVIQGFLPNLRKSQTKVIANISSRMGSIEENKSGGVLGYRASKTALNSFNKSLSIEYAAQGFTFVVLHPGWVRTDMTSERATYSTMESAEKLYQVLSHLKQKDNGKFFDLHGNEIGW